MYIFVQVINFFTLEKLPFNSASLPSDLDGLCLMLQICEDLSHVNRKFLRQILFSKIKQMLQKDIILLVKLLKKSPLMPALTNLCMSLLELHIVPLSIYFPQSLAEIDFSIFVKSTFLLAFTLRYRKEFFIPIPLPLFPMTQSVFCLPGNIVC